MKTYILLLISFFCLGQLVNAQDANEASFKLSNTDTIPEFDSQLNKLKISGIIYEKDGVTPARDVILYIEQADENGDFELRKHNDEKYVYHSGAIKTDADGRYTFYTFVPGNDRRYNQLQQLFPVVKKPSEPEYIVPSFLFDSDPMLTKKCRKRMAKKDDLTRILKPTMKDGLLIVEKDIVIQDSTQTTK